jgi:hypothetical protein
MGQVWFAQEYLCEFIDDGGAWFGREMVEAALGGGEPLWLQVRPCVRFTYPYKPLPTLI